MNTAVSSVSAVIQKYRYTSISAGMDVRVLFAPLLREPPTLFEMLRTPEVVCPEAEGRLAKTVRLGKLYIRITYKV